MAGVERYCQHKIEITTEYDGFFNMSYIIARCDLCKKTFSVDDIEGFLKDYFDIKQTHIEIKNEDHTT